MDKEKQLRKIAKDFKNNMQEVVDKSEGFTSISVQVGDGKPIMIAEKKSQHKTETMEKKHEKLYLECLLTTDEKLEMSKELSDHISKKARAEDNLKSVKSQISAEIAGHESHINKIAEVLGSGKEWRNVDCEVTYDFKNGKKKFVRTDTFEICREIPIPEGEYQLEIKTEA